MQAWRQQTARSNAWANGGGSGELQQWRARASGRRQPDGGRQLGSLGRPRSAGGCALASHLSQHATAKQAAANLYPSSPALPLLTAPTSPALPTKPRCACLPPLPFPVLSCLQELGVQILSDLQRQRETILHSRDTLHTVDSHVSRSRQILQSMSRRITQNKLIMWGIILLLLGAIGLVLYAKF